MPLTSGVTLAGRYRIGTWLAREPLADVYQAEDLEQHIQVAIRSLRPALVADRESMAALRRRADILATLDHPFILRFHRLLEQDGEAYGVTDLVPMATLRRRLDEAGGPLPLAAATLVLRNVSAALEYIHGQGIIHGAVAPGNILIEDDVALLDGLALRTEGEAAPAWLSPEQFGGGPVDARSDVYSLSAVLFEMLTGVAGNAATAQSAEARPGSSRQAFPPELLQLNPELPASLSAVIIRALAAGPQERWPDARSFRQAWEAALAGMDQVAQEAGPPPVTETTAPGKVARSIIPKTWFVALFGVLAVVAWLFGRGVLRLEQDVVASDRSAPASIVSGAAGDRTAVAGLSISVTPAEPGSPAGADLAFRTSVGSTPPVAAGRSPTAPASSVSVDNGPTPALTASPVVPPFRTLVPTPPATATSTPLPSATATPAPPPSAVVTPVLSPPATDTPAPRPSATAILVPPPSAVATPAPPPSATAAPPPATATPDLADPYAVLQADANIRGGPGAGYPRLGGLPAQSRVVIVGRSQDGDWLDVCCVEGQPGWIWAPLAVVEGNIERAPVIIAALLFASTPVPTAPLATQAPPSPVLSACLVPLAALFARLPDWRLSLGCPIIDPTQADFSHQYFQRGQMLYRQDLRTIYVLYDDGTWVAYEDTYVEGQPLRSENLNPPPGLKQPVRAFDRVWEQPDVRDRLGWATRDQVSGIPGPAQDFTNGSAVWIGRSHYLYASFVLFIGGSWAWYP